ncbi:ubiquitin-like protein [Erysiphe pulchra]|uniref:Ubiquitin-like protein n=1 Tax=Erysiphe pulchra TaxID=225359 RepID=A0A2S4PTM7_9PEZI|nr:ubiquitin-like protein [Erysiphe pulchra]
MAATEHENQNATEKSEAPAQSEHLNIKVTDNNNEVFFKIKRTTPLKKLMDAFCERQGKSPASVRFLFEGSRVQQTDSPEFDFVLILYTLFGLGLSDL